LQFANDLGLFARDRFDGDKAAGAATVDELHTPIDLCEQRVI
jgi:hypothetical protein